jgi:type II secretory pathway component PulF
MPNIPFSQHQQILLCQQVAKLARAKLPLMGELVRATQGLAPALTGAAQAVEEQIASGKSLADVLANDKSRNSQILSACIEAGERSDALDRTLECWSEMHIANAKSSKAMRTAMVYPILLIIVTMLSLGYVIWKLIPEYRATYVLFSREMPDWLSMIVRIREQLGPLLILLLALMVLPLAVWFWRRRTFSADRMPREPAQRLRLQALATELTAHMLTASVPLTEVVRLSAKAMYAKDQLVEQAFELLKNQRLLAPLPRETSMLLASLHAGLIGKDEAATHLHAVAHHLQQSAEIIAIRNARWIPMLVALVVGLLTILTYVFLVYLPWIALMTKIVSPDYLTPSE